MNSTIIDVKCTHCGDDCKDELIQLEEKNFCCEGCKMVYEILNENNMCRFYDIDENAGVRIKTPKNTPTFDYLDNPKITQQLIDFEDDKMVKVTFLLPQIHCSACIWLLENLYRLNDGVIQSKVNFLKKEVYITYLKEQTTLKYIVALLASIGYAPAIQLDNLNKKTIVTDKKLYYQIGLAGFVFGNVMFFSFPEYFGLDSVEEESFYRFFGYINLILSLPVVLYSAQHYFQSAWAGLRQRHLNIDVPISIGILTLFGRSAFEILTSTGAGYLDSLAGLVFFLLIGKWFQQRTYHQIAFDKDYQSYFPISANRKRNGATENVALTELEAKDVILVKNKELIPADAILLKGKAYIDYSFVTGESNPVSRRTGEQLYAGGRQEGEAIEVQLTKAVAQSYLTQLWNSEAFQKDGDKQYTELINRISKYFTATILGIAFVSGAYWLTIDTSIAVNVFTAVLIIACPCAIALSVPFTLGNALRILAKNGFYLKNTTVIERMAMIKHVVFDKTGTITNVNNSQVNYFGRNLTDLEKDWVTALAHQSSHPVSQKIQGYFSREKVNFSTQKITETIGEGITGEINGHRIGIGSQRLFKTKKLEAKGTYIEIDGEVTGYFTVRNRPRKGLTQLIQAFKLRYRLYLLSGDNEREAAFFENILPIGSVLEFNQKPEDKLIFIKKIQEQYPNDGVMMLGDGLNDAGALKQSDVGIAVSENTQHFSPACDGILEAKQFPKLLELTEFASRSLKTVRYSLVISLIYNIIGLFFAVQGLLSPVIAAILMPLSSVSVVVFGFVATNILANRIFKKKEETIDLLAHFD